MSRPQSGGSIIILNGNYPSDLGHLLPLYLHYTLYISMLKIGVAADKGVHNLLVSLELLIS